jgi:hypothetical protein
MVGDEAGDLVRISNYEIVPEIHIESRRAVSEYIFA